jgi:prepilin-type N-terminal cleavage/methylation domain-containing protein
MPGHSRHHANLARATCGDSRRPIGPRRWQCGFTLIELLLVLAIVTVVGLLAAPRYQAATERFRADSAARRVVADMALLRVRARALCAPQTLSVSAGGGSYTLNGMTDPDHPSATYKVNLNAEPYRATIVSVAFGTTGNTSVVTFNGYGMPSAGGSVVVAVGGSRRTITIDATSGEVTAQ